MIPEMNELRKLKEELCTKRLEISLLTKSSPWSEAKLDAVLSKLKNGKARDPLNIVREIFKPGVLEKI